MIEHWWGFAAMPQGMEYPSNGQENPLTLVCQFALGDGLVYVLADLDYFFGDFDVESGCIGEWDKRFYKILYSPTRDNLQTSASTIAVRSSSSSNPRTCKLVTSTALNVSFIPTKLLKC